MLNPKILRSEKVFSGFFSPVLTLIEEQVSDTKLEPQCRRWCNERLACSGSKKVKRLKVKFDGMCF